MISVKKTTPLKSFADFVRRENPQKWEDLHHNKKSPNLYHDTKARLVDEQGGVSAYTEEPLSGDAHIDHFRKRDLFPNLTFDWNNLFVDGMSESYGARFKDKNIKKGDYALLISPAEEKCRTIFLVYAERRNCCCRGLVCRRCKKGCIYDKGFQSDGF